MLTALQPAATRLGAIVYVTTDHRRVRAGAQSTPTYHRAQRDLYLSRKLLFADEAVEGSHAIHSASCGHACPQFGCCTVVWRPFSLC
jgi:hypothetical protein